MQPASEFVKDYRRRQKPRSADAFASAACTVNAVKANIKAGSCGHCECFTTRSAMFTGFNLALRSTDGEQARTFLAGPKNGRYTAWLDFNNR